MRALTFIALVAISATVWSVTERMSSYEVYDAVFWLLSGGLWFYIAERLLFWTKEVMKGK